jgi:hypothetical protein
VKRNNNNDNDDNDNDKNSTNNNNNDKDKGKDFKTSGRQITLFLHITHYHFPEPSFHCAYK